MQSDERPSTSSINPTQLKSSTDDQNSNSYSISTLRSLLSFTSFDSSPVTYFFAHVNSSYWIDTLDTTKQTSNDLTSFKCHYSLCPSPIKSH
ncbi:unnamed protein product [Rotaria sp. Silwood2]|nr:unnamed protein product [Rotaria sp. Silwood2]CAF2889865.1 unnamed protein product [Rotaria sp. Silwood2]CAF3245368.1 unnamed protein product [Rotaria sp. Silwood2]CAF4347745.1 unnamed protein product [Rotaria sp. Silwood2]CAF4381603.1 unnamed protein product [Rotaria sp. Silwood2]